MVGGRGFIGTHISRYYSAMGYNVLRLERGQNLRVDNVIYSDYQDANWLKGQLRLLNNPIVFHMAAYIPPREKITERCVFEENKKIIDFFCHTFRDLTPKKVVYFSSIAVYGYGYRSLDWVNENSEIYIQDAYAEGKVYGEEKIRAMFSNSYILRLSSPFGVGRRNTGILERIVASAQQNQNICLHGRGNRTQDFIYINDICQSTDKLLASAQFGVYNLASGFPCTMKQLAEMVIDIFSSKSLIAFRVLPETDFVTVSNQKLRNTTGFCFMDIKEGLNHYKNALAVRGSE